MYWDIFKYDILESYVILFYHISQTMYYYLIRSWDQSQILIYIWLSTLPH
jgi:hypothetical protein